VVDYEFATWLPRLGHRQCVLVDDLLLEVLDILTRTEHHIAHDTRDYYLAHDPPSSRWPTMSQRNRRTVSHSDHSSSGVSRTQVTCAIFGRKVRDFDNWTLLEPFHVWLEPDEPQG
jgi:hypothetical protein